MKNIPIKMVIWVITIWLNSIPGSQSSPTDDIKLWNQLQQTSTGLYLEKLPDPIFYTHYSPQVYEFLIPMWSNSDLTLRDWRGKCTTDSFSPSYSCVVFYYYEKFIERLQDQLVAPKQTFQPTYSNNLKPHSTDFCSRIEDHFIGFQTTKASMEEYFRQLRTCPANQVNITRSISDYTYNIKDLYKAMNRKFETEFSDRISSGSREGPSHYVNALSSHQNTMVMNYWMEESRWNLARLACLTNTIPLSLIPSMNFTQDLTTLDSILKSKGVQMSIPFNDTSVYYKLPITDCTTTDSGNFVVRVLVPVIGLNSTAKLVKTQTIPFIYKKDGTDLQLCEIDLPPNDVYYVIDENSKFRVQKSECTEANVLCHIDNGDHMTRPHPCVLAYISNSKEGMQKHCKVSCKSYNDTLGATYFPMVKQVDTDRWIITGSVADTPPFANIKCPMKTDQLIHFEDNFGALEIQLPCGCQLQIHGQEFFAQEPCGSDLMLFHDTPNFFIKDDIVKKWNPKAMAIIWKVKEEYLKDFVISTENDSTTDDSELYVVDDSNDTYTNGSAPQDDNSSNSSESSSVFQKYRITINHTQTSSTGLIWTLFFVQLTLVCLILGFGAYKFKALRDAALYSKERLVYNVTTGSSSNITTYDDVGQTQNILGGGNDVYRSSTVSGGTYFN